MVTPIPEPVLAFDLPDSVDTPTVIVDVNALDANIASMATRLQDRGVGLCPHTKTSKCIEVIARQVAAGVSGLTVATIGEGEVLADAGYTELFLAYPVWAGFEPRARRLRALHERADLCVGVESVESARALGAATAGSERALGVVIEIDSGMRRTGVEIAEVVTIAAACAAAGLDVRGAFTFGGHGYRDCDAPPGAADDEVRALTHSRDVLISAGFDVHVLSAGSSPTAVLSARPPVTDERPGTYVFQDRLQVGIGAAPIDSVAMVVLATVVASHRDGHFVLDAGSKSLSSDRAAWLDGYGHLPAYPEAVIRSLSEHHAVVWTTGPRPSVGERVAVVPNHACVVVNLVDELTVVSGGAVVDTWRVASRGRNS